MLGTSEEDAAVRSAADILNDDDDIDEHMITKAKQWYRAAKSRKFDAKDGNINALEYLCLHAVCLENNVAFNVKIAEIRSGLHKKYTATFAKFCKYLEIDFCPSLAVTCVKHGSQSIRQPAEQIYGVISRKNSENPKPVQMAAAFLVACEASGQRASSKLRKDVCNDYMCKPNLVDEHITWIKEKFGTVLHEIIREYGVADHLESDEDDVRSTLLRSIKGKGKATEEVGANGAISLRKTPTKSAAAANGSTPRKRNRVIDEVEANGDMDYEEPEVKTPSAKRLKVDSTILSNSTSRNGHGSNEAIVCTPITPPTERTSSARTPVRSASKTTPRSGSSKRAPKGQKDKLPYYCGWHSFVDDEQKHPFNLTRAERDGAADEASMALDAVRVAEEEMRSIRISK
ncbi:hypothetical protein SeMB42_g00473 [Synchytrium endobioticum]|uniref:Origin recognition complex subunit 6 n=1 Tax=Synchytrium endobioticum TaxID=286115 RepID=A0A507DRB2_9FUNG|nr:hypothetical protein SeLEV6574_g00335 [Synchytrium endobioticum]TPX54076.1 hypothetical protein SeMB42_g00473 [Synchytrium endobioticum]